MIDTKALETSILGCILTVGRKAMLSVPELTVHSFAHKDSRDVFSACLRLDGDDVGLDISTVGAELKGRVATSIISGMADNGVPMGMLPSVVRQLNVSRAVNRAELMADRVKSIAGGTATLGDRIDDIARIGQEMVGLGSTRFVEKDVLISLDEVIDLGIKKADDALFQENTTPHIRTGIRRVDEIVRIVPGQLAVIAGATGSGKSSLCGQIAMKAAADKHPVIFVTSEMSHLEMLARMTAIVTGTAVSKLVDPVEAAEHGGQEDYGRLRGLPLTFQRVFPPKIEDAGVAIRTAVAKHGAKLAVIDYAQRLARTEEGDNTEQAIARIAAESKNIALELGIVVVAAAQVNRQATGRKNPKPFLEDLRGSGALEQNADIVMFTHQPSHYGLQGPPQIIVAKQRNGPIGEVDVIFNKETCVFRSA